MSKTIRCCPRCGKPISSSQYDAEDPSRLCSHCGWWGGVSETVLREAVAKVIDANTFRTMLAVYRRIVRDELVFESKHAIGAISDDTMADVRRYAEAGAEALVDLIKHLYERAHGKH